MKKYKIFLVLLGFLFVFLIIGCKTFKTSSLEDSDNKMLASYALCIRAMSDGSTEVSGKNVSFCNDFKTEAIKESRYNMCLDVSDFDKRLCFRKIFKIEL